MPEEPSTRLESGFHAVIRPDRFVPGSYELVVDGTPQSHVNIDDPTEATRPGSRQRGDCS